MKNSSNFLAKLERFVFENKLIKTGDKVLVGFSGGADSTSLLLGLWHLKSRYRFSILAAHINYNLRGDDSLIDQEFVKNFCFKRNISLVIKSVTLKTESNLENKAREIRFEYFNKISTLYKINKIALGHNKNDQAETVILRLFRGAGLTGLRGIKPMNNQIIHPLLPFSRQEILDFLKQENTLWREDLSNQENIFSRNKVRNELLPWITKNLNAKVIERLFDTSSIFGEMDDILRNLANLRISKALIKHSQDDFRFSLEILRKTKSILRFYIYREIYKRLSGDEKDFYQKNFEIIESIIYSQGSKKIILPKNIYVFKEYNDLIFGNVSELEEIDVQNKREIVSLRNRFTFEDYRIIMKKLKKIPPKRYLFEDKKITYIDLDKTSFPITIRHRQSGDRFYPLGMKNSKKLKDFFIDEKVPKFERDKVLLFCDNEKILWIAGMRIDNRVAVTNSTKNILKLKIEKIASHKARPAERFKKRK